MFSLQHEIEIAIDDLPVQWIPKIELYYPDLPQFPIMYIHFWFQGKRIIACPVSVSYEIKNDKCTASFFVITNEIPSEPLVSALTNEISNRIGFSNRITKQTVIDCCNGNVAYEGILCDLWQYIEKSYGSSIPYGRFYEEIYSIPRFVAAWQPKTGRQSEMRMLYNFMSAFGEEVSFPNNWSHLEYYVIPTYHDVRTKDYSLFPTFKKLYSAMVKLFNLDFTNSVTIDGVPFKVMPKAWKQNKDDFIKNVSARYYTSGKLTEEDKYYAEMLVDAFNRHPWRAAYFISAFLTIEYSDYKTWNKQFFKDFYESGSKLKGYSEKVIACFLQQGFGNEEVIPIDTWIETFYQFPLGITSRSQFYDDFLMLGKLERVIWLASQSNKTNMKNFFDILWCQRYGTIGNGELRGVNPLACSLCKLKSTCVGLSKSSCKKVYMGNNVTADDITSGSVTIPSNVLFVCLLENNIPKKVLKKYGTEWILVDEFSGYLMTSQNKIPREIVVKQVISVQEFTDLF
ncbi:MAG: hypothetical protein ACI4J6_11515 [Oscillospiraceae bacterium]